MKRNLLFTLGAVVAVLLVAAQISSFARRHEKGIRVMVWGELDTAQIMRNSIASYNRSAKTPARVVFVPFLHYFEKLATELAAGQAPDVVWVEANNIGQLQGNGALLDLEPFVLRDKLNLKDFYPEIVERFRVGGRQFAIPQDIAPVACVYFNKDMFKAAGIEAPYGGWTWDQFLAACKKLTQKDASGKITRFAYIENYGPAYHSFLYANGGDIVDDPNAPTRLTLGDPAAVEGIQFLADLINRHEVYPGPGVRDSFGGLGQDLFANEKVAMFHSGIWVVPFLRKISKFSWDVLPLPRGPRSKRPGWGGGGSGWAITAGSRNPEEAWKLVKYLSGSDTQRSFAAIGYVQPAIRELAESPLFTQNHPPEHKSFLLKAVKDTHFEPRHAHWKEAEQQVLNPLMDQVMMGKMSAREAVEQALPKMKERMGLK